MNDLVSVIVPVYNVEKYIRRCVDSILAQTYKNIEIILVDDGSKDESGRICDEYSKIDTRIIVVHKENGGLSSARNMGLDICHGKYILFVDSDDWIRDDAVEVAKSFIKNSEIEIVAFSFYIADSNIKSNDYEIKHINVHNSELNTSDDLLQNFHRDWNKIMIVAWNKLYKKTVFDNLRFKEGVYHEDEYAIVEILKQTQTIYSIDIPLYFYAMSENSIMRNKNCKINHKKTIDLIEMYKERVEIFIDMEYINEARYAFLDYITTIKEYYCSSDNEVALDSIKNHIRGIKKLLSYKKLKESLSYRFVWKLKSFCLWLELKARWERCIDGKYK